MAINIDDLKKVDAILKEQVTKSMELVGKHDKNFGLLCDIIGKNEVLIKRLQDPIKTIKLDKQYESKLWK